MQNSNLKLTKDEEEILDEIEKGNFIDVHDFETEKNRLSKIAGSYLKRKAISIRLFESDVNKLKSIALSEGIPYQTLISSILHKFATQNMHSDSNYAY